MEALAYRIFQTGNSNSLFFSWGMLFAFAAIVVALVKPKFRLGQAAYFFVMGLCLLFWGMRYFIDGFFLEALKNDYLFELLLSSYSCLIIGTVLLGLASAARSNDAYGHWKNWYLGFIPIISLVLLFKRSQEPAKSGFPRLARNILLVVLGLFLFGSGRMLTVLTDRNSEQIARNEQNDPQLQRKVGRYELQNRGLNGWLKEVAGNIHPPEIIDESTVMTSAEVDEATLRFVYERADGRVPYSRLWLNMKTYEMCKAANFIALIEAGGTIEKKYIGQQGVPLGEAKANTQLCEQLQVQIPQIVREIVNEWQMTRQLDSETVWSFSEYKDGKLNAYYDYSGDQKNIKWDDVRRRLCRGFMFVEAMAFGVDVRGVYRTPQKVEIADLVVNDASCAAFRGK